MLWQNRLSFDPWRDLDRLHREVNRLFHESSRSAPRAEQRPICNVWTGQEAALVRAEVPGVDPASLDVSVTGNTLTIRGERASLELGENDSVHRRERPTGAFVRAIDLPFQVDSSQVEATCDRGVLSIRLPRAEADKPRQITIQTR